MITIAQLNGVQRQAVEWGEGPLLVLAGPGSGKTAVLTLRISELIRSTPEENFRILGLTFTVKAAKTMEERVDNLLGGYNRRVHIRTFHSFCTELLRQHGSQLGLKPDFTVISDDKDRIALLKELEIDEPEDALKKVDAMFTHGIGIDDLPLYFDDSQHEQCQQLQAVFSSYLAALVNGNQLDFGSMLHFASELLFKKPRITRQIRTVYKYICVDEFQDTNLAQYHVLKHLVNPQSQNLFVVADDDQVVFQWNGADPKRLESLEEEFNTKVLQLPDNYRCPSEIVELANRLIQHNSNRFEGKGKGVSRSQQSGVITLTHYPNFDAEVEGLSQALASISRGDRQKCLVIARSNKLLLQVEAYLNQQGIRAEIVSKRQDFSSPLMLSIYFSLKLANSGESRSILNKLCAAATAANGGIISSEDVAAKAKVEDISLLRAFFETAKNSDILRPLCEQGIRLLCDQLRYVDFIAESMLVFDEMASGTDGKIFADYQDDRENWDSILVGVKRTYGGEPSLHLLLQEIDLTPKAKPLTRDCVRLQTVHTSKGMEFDQVFLIGLAEDQFPTYFAIKQGQKSVEEERRNCFVAITRSSRKLHLSYASQYFGWHKQPSRFLREMELIDAR